MNTGAVGPIESSLINLNSPTDSVNSINSHMSDQQGGSIASDQQVQYAIAILDQSSTSSSGERERGHSNYPYTRGASDYKDSRGFLNGSKDWGQPSKAPEKSHERTPAAHSDNSSSGSSGVGMDDSYNHMSHDPMSSRSTSMSPGMDGKEHVDGSGKGEGHDEEENRHYNPKGSIDSGINLHGQRSKKKSWERDQNLLFGGLIPSDPSMANSDPNYSMLDHLHLFKRMGEDSDSEKSG